MNIGYIRVSTNKQDTENQKFEITKYAENNGLVIDRWFEETISGTKAADKRKLGAVLDESQHGDTIICTEISRLGRSLFMAMDILNLCMSKGVNVWTTKENYKLGTDISSAILAFAFSLSAQIERDLISQRTKAGLDRRRADGVKLGGPKGSKNAKVKLSGKEDVIKELITQGQSQSAIVRIFHVDRTTLMRFVKNCGIYGINNHTSTDIPSSDCGDLYPHIPHDFAKMSDTNCC